MPNVNKTNVLIALLEYIDLFNPSDNMKNDEMIIWEGLPCSLPFYIAVFYFEHGYCS